MCKRFVKGTITVIFAKNILIEWEVEVDVESRHSLFGLWTHFFKRWAPKYWHGGCEGRCMSQKYEKRKKEFGVIILWFWTWIYLKPFLLKISKKNFRPRKDLSMTESCRVWEAIRERRATQRRRRRRTRVAWGGKIPSTRSLSGLLFPRHSLISDPLSRGWHWQYRPLGEWGRGNYEDDIAERQPRQRPGETVISARDVRSRVLSLTRICADYLHSQRTRGRKWGTVGGEPGVAWFSPRYFRFQKGKPWLCFVAQ